MLHRNASKITIIKWPGNVTSCFLQTTIETKFLKSHRHADIHCNTIDNIWNVEITWQMNGWKLCEIVGSYLSFNRFLKCKENVPNLPVTCSTWDKSFLPTLCTNTPDGSVLWLLWSQAPCLCPWKHFPLTKVSVITWIWNRACKKRKKVLLCYINN